MIKALSFNLPVTALTPGFGGQARRGQHKPPVRLRELDQFVRFGQQAAEQPDYEAIARNTRVVRQGYDITGRITFTVSTDQPLKAHDAMQVQTLLGYHPVGYDFMGFRSTLQEDGKHLNTWKCSASCD